MAGDYHILRAGGCWAKEFRLVDTSEDLVCNIARRWGTGDVCRPLVLYQTGPKYRDERQPSIHAGVFREFLMNEVYSFHGRRECLDRTYDIVKNVYAAFLSDLGMRVAFKAVSPDPDRWTSEEIRVSTTNDVTSRDFNTKYPANQIRPEDWEMAHVYKLGDTFTAAHFAEKGVDCGAQVPLMGSYGLGVSRLAVLLFRTAQRLPRMIAPWDVAVLAKDGHPHSHRVCRDLRSLGLSVVLDVRLISRQDRMRDAESLGARLALWPANDSGGWELWDFAERKKRTFVDAVEIPRTLADG